MVTVSSSALQAKLELSQIPALDGLRAIAVALVILYHFGIPNVPGAHGVMIFFVLSGFLITWLLLRENERTGSVSLRAFYRRRMLRIFPAFYVYWLGLVILLTIAGKSINWPHALAAFFYVSNYYNAILGDPNTGFSHTWSLAIEEQFYLLWPFVFLRLRHDLRRMTVFLVGLIAVVWLYRLILLVIFDVHQGYFYAAFETRMDSLMAGCLLAVLLKRRVLSSTFEVLSTRPLLLVVTVGLLLVSIFGGGRLLSRYRDVIGFAVEPVIIAALIVQVVGLAAHPAVRWIDSAVFQFLGRISYSLYLYQQITLEPVRKLLVSQPLLLQFVAAVVFTILIASFSYYVIERPFLALKGRQSEKSTLIGR